MKLKGTKCIEILKSEYDDIKFIDTISSCIADAEDNVVDYLIRDRKIDIKLPNFIIRKIAYNLYMAVTNDYKYMKVVNDEETQ